MDEEAIRRDFEVWATMKHYSLRCSESPHKYVYPDTQSAWDAWAESARRADKLAREECCRILAALKVAEECATTYDNATTAILNCAIAEIRATIPEEPT